MKTAVVTDTNSGIGEQEASQLGIFLVPMPVIIEGKTSFEGMNLNEEQLCTYLKEGREISTSQPSAGALIAKWNEILESGYDELVYIPMSSGLSGSCNTARMLAEDYSGKVAVADNHRVSVTQRIAVMNAKKMAEEQMGASEIAEELEKDGLHSSIYVAVENIEHLRRGGRISPAAASIASVLSVKPILSIQGEKLEPYTVVRGRLDRCEKKMIEAIQKDIEKRFPEDSPADTWIGAAGFGISEEEKNAWIQLCVEAFPGANIYYDALPASVGTHTGAKAAGIGISFSRNKHSK